LICTESSAEMRTRVKYYVVDAFTDSVFGGNPAGICILDQKIPDETMLKIAAENNLSETAFLLKENGRNNLRWFTPEVEFDLCGHATLGTSYVVFHYLEPESKEVEYDTMSGILRVTQNGDLMTMNFPSRPPVQEDLSSLMQQGFNRTIYEVYKSRDLFLVFESEADVRDMIPDLNVLAKINRSPEFGVIVTAKGDTCDFVSRYFSPNSVIGEDPVTGSAHCSLIPFWSERLGKTQLRAKQLSMRGGELLCEDCGERVNISGRAVCYMVGEIMIH